MALVVEKRIIRVYLVCDLLIDLHDKLIKLFLDGTQVGARQGFDLFPDTARRYSGDVCLSDQVYYMQSSKKVVSRLLG